MRFVTLACCFACITAVVTTSARARAEGADVARAHATVKIAGDAVAIDAMGAVLRERMANAQTEGAIETVPKVSRSEVLAPPVEAERELARIWIDLSEDPLLVYVVDDAGQRVLVRTVPRGANPEVAREEIGHIVEVALGALRAGERIGVERTELVEDQPAAAVPALTPPPEPPPDAPAESPRREEPRWTWDGSLYYAVRMQGSGPELRNGPGIALGLLRRLSRFAVGANLSAEYRFPSTVGGAPASVRFEGYAFHLLPKVELAFDRSTVDLALGPGFEITDAEARDPVSATAALESERTRIDPLFRGLVRYGFATSILRVFAGVGVDVPMRNPSYVLIQQGERVVLFAPWVVRPFLVIGIETN